MYHTNKQSIESRRKPESFEIYSRSTHSDCRQLCVRLCVRVQVRGDGAFGGSRMAVRDDSAAARDEDAAEVCGRSCSRATPRQTRDRLEAAQSVAAFDDVSGEEGSGDILGRPHSSIQTSLRRLHMKLGHRKTTS